MNVNTTIEPSPCFIIFIVVKGISEGIEKASKIMMPALFVLFLVLVVRAFTLLGAMAGIKYYLTPDFSKLYRDHKILGITFQSTCLQK